MTTAQRVARKVAKYRSENRCITCGCTAVASRRSRTGFSKFCLRHLVKARETKRKEVARARAIEAEIEVLREQSLGGSNSNEYTK